MRFTLILFGFAAIFSAKAEFSNGYYSWILGNKDDVQTNPTQITLCQGGGTDIDEAMAEMLRNADGGDVIVIREGGGQIVPDSTADAYNLYFYSQLKVKVDSVETIFLNSAAVAKNPDVVAKIRNAECVFFTGGDQHYYYDFIQGSPLQDALTYVQRQKKVPIGGTSAGCAIMGQYIFSADSNYNYETSQPVLDNPYDSHITIRESFLGTPYFDSIITDTHYTQRDRHGRQVVFMARMATDFQVQLPAGIGIDQETAIFVDKNGQASVYGKDHVYFIIQYRRGDGPETCKPHIPLNWDRDDKALQVYRIPGTENGRFSFNLTSFNSGTGIENYFWYVNHGNMHEDRA